MITYLVSINLCENIFLQCYGFYNFSSFRSSCWRCSVRKGVLRIFKKFTGKHLWQSLFFYKVAGWDDCFWSFLYLLMKISFLFHFSRKMKWKKGNTLLEFKYLLFCSISVKKKNYWKLQFCLCRSSFVLAHLRRYYKIMYIVALSCFLTYFHFAWKGNHQHLILS